MTSPSTTKTNKPVVALIAAAGMGTRLGAEVPKAYVELQGRTLLERSVAAMAHSGVVKRAVVTVSPAMEDTARTLLADAPFIFADEPTGALDDDTADVVMDHLVRVPSTVVMVTHSHAAAAKADRIYKLEEHHVRMA